MKSPSLFSTLTAAPHRVMFLGGMVQLVVTLLWWSGELAGRYTAISLPLPSSPFAGWLHGWLMIFGLMPFFMFGFLMTTYPRWMNGPVVPRSRYVSAALLLMAGVALFYLGIFADARVMAVGVALHWVGFAVAFFSLFRVYRAVGSRCDRRYERQLNLALLFALLAEGLYLTGLVSGEGWFLQSALRGALWLFLIPVLVLVAHRMIPFFSRGVLPGYVVIQPQWSFPVLWLAVSLHPALETVGAKGWLFLADLPLLFLAAHHTIKWGLGRSLSVPLLGSLHLAFAFLSIGLALSIIQSLWLCLTGERVLGYAPLHGVGIGFVSGMVVAMVTRVSRGHSGRTLEMDRRDRYAFLGVLTAAVVRIAAEIPPVVSVSPVSLTLLAGLIALFAVVPWVLRYLPIYLRPRLDGEAG